MPTAVIISASGPHFGAVVGSDGRLWVDTAITTGSIGTYNQPPTTGSFVPIALPSGTWVFTNPITNTEAWAVSVSGASAYDLSLMSGGTMLFHSLTAGTIWTEDTSPSKIAVRTSLATSGLVEMWT